MRALPSRLKIALLSAGLSGLVLVVFGMVAWVTFYHQRLAATDRDIKTLAARHPGLFAGRGNIDRLDSSLAFAYGEDYTNQVFLLVQDSGRTLYQSPGVPGKLPGFPLAAVPATAKLISTNEPADDTPSEPGRSGRDFGQGRWRGGYGHGGPPPPIVFTNAQFSTIRDGDVLWRVGLLYSQNLQMALGINLRAVYKELGHVRNTFLIALPVALVLIGFAGWIVAGRALSPLNSIAETAEAVTAHGLDRRIPNTHEGPEIKRVITLLNRMMDRLEASFRQASRFSADASHELKTPLAIMQAELEIALQESDPGSGQQRLCSRLLENVQRLKTITRGLLVLAQADAGQLKLTREELDLRAELDGVLEDAQVIAGETKLTFENNLSARIPFYGDRALIRMALFNLLSNSVKYNEEGGRVSLQAHETEDMISVLIGNTGPGIPLQDQENLFTRFYRAHRKGNAPVDGLGLGLSLAREIARSHGGNLELLESRSGWTAFALTLPTKQSAGRGVSALRSADQD